MFKNEMPLPYHLSENPKERENEIRSYLIGAKRLRIKNDKTSVDLTIHDKTTYKIVRQYTEPNLKGKKKIKENNEQLTFAQAVDFLMRFPGYIERRDPIDAPVCPYCHNRSVLKAVEGVVPTCYKWACVSCNAHVLCHQDTCIPMGMPAKPELRKLRKDAHKLMRDIMELNGQSPLAVYADLAASLNQSRKKTHMGIMNEEECREAIRHLLILIDKAKEKAEIA